MAMVTYSCVSVYISFFSVCNGQGLELSDQPQSLQQFLDGTVGNSEEARRRDNEA